MKTKKINSEFDKRVIEVLRCVVPSQSMRLIGAEGEQWESVANEKDNLAITTIKKDGEEVAKIIYDYNSGEEKEFIY